RPCIQVGCPESTCEYGKAPSLARFTSSPAAPARHAAPARARCRCRRPYTPCRADRGPSLSHTSDTSLSRSSNCRAYSFSILGFCPRDVASRRDPVFHVAARAAHMQRRRHCVEQVPAADTNEVPGAPGLEFSGNSDDVVGLALRAPLRILHSIHLHPAKSRSIFSAFARSAGCSSENPPAALNFPKSVSVSAADPFTSRSSVSSPSAPYASATSQSLIPIVRTQSLAGPTHAESARLPRWARALPFCPCFASPSSAPTFVRLSRSTGRRAHPRDAAPPGSRAAWRIVARAARRPDIRT